MIASDYRDGVIDAFADENASLREQIHALAARVAVAEAERDAYRLVAVAGLHSSHDLHLTVTELRERYHRALDDARRMRIQILESQGDSSRAA